MTRFIRALQYDVNGQGTYLKLVQEDDVDQLHYFIHHDFQGIYASPEAFIAEANSVKTEVLVVADAEKWPEEWCTLHERTGSTLKSIP